VGGSRETATEGIGEVEIEVVTEVTEAGEAGVVEAVVERSPSRSKLEECEIREGSEEGEIVESEPEECAVHQRGGWIERGRLRRCRRGTERVRVPRLEVFFSLFSIHHFIHDLSSFSFLLIFWGGCERAGNGWLREGHLLIPANRVSPKRACGTGKNSSAWRIATTRGRTRSRCRGGMRRRWRWRARAARTRRVTTRAMVREVRVSGPGSDPRAGAVGRAVPARARGKEVRAQGATLRGRTRRVGAEPGPVREAGGVRSLRKRRVRDGEAGWRSVNGRGRGRRRSRGRVGRMRACGRGRRGGGGDEGVGVGVGIAGVGMVEVDGLNERGRGRQGVRREVG
jgi:hypothetical protein